MFTYSGFSLDPTLLILMRVFVPFTKPDKSAVIFLFSEKLINSVTISFAPFRMTASTSVFNTAVRKLPFFSASVFRKLVNAV